MRAVCISVVLAASALLAHAQQREASVTLQSTITGNREQPRVMYIVPWQQPEAAELGYELRNAIAEDLFTQVDRDEFVRGLVYRHRLAQRRLAAAAEAAALTE